jgi:hypothetical protein
MSRTDVQERDDEGLSAPHTAKGKLQRLVLRWLRAKHKAKEIPTSIRFVFYELEQQEHVSKRATNQDGTPSKRKPGQNLTDAITDVRNAGLVPWDWLVDDSRSVSAWHCAPTVHDYQLDTVDRARIDPWQGGRRPVLITESRTIGGVLERSIGSRYLVAIAPCGGHCHGFLVNEVAPLLEDPDTLVGYLGDNDLCGNQIENRTRATLEKHLGRELDWERVALTDAQVGRLRAKGVEPIEKTDRRHKDGRPHLAYECEALGQAQVVALVRRWPDRLLPEPLADVLEHEARQQEEMREYLERYQPEGGEA